MTETSPLDDRGRFTVDPKWRKRLGRRIYQIWTPSGLLLVPAREMTKEELRRLADMGDEGELAAREEAE